MPPQSKPLPVQTAPSQGYGERVAQERAQQAVPLAPPPSAPSQGPREPRRGPLSWPGMPPIVPLDTPTQRPEEPLTSGIASGPGPGPEALWPGGRPPRSDDRLADELHFVFARYPSEVLREMLEEL
ncbi:MAG: hypothetical protein M3Q48_14740 [Actinomycetota bacterium]|nr:hypothetical protein [Actinomycetota bacterium]